MTAVTETEHPANHSGGPAEVGRGGRGRRAPIAGGLRAAQQAVLRAFAAGAPPSAELIEGTAAPCGRPGADVLRQLHTEDFLRLDENGVIRTAYPFSAVPTAHRVRIDGGAEVYAMCAVDALGIAAMLGRDVVIESRDPQTAAPITVHVAANGATAWEPATAVVLAGRLARGAAADCCDQQAAADVCCGLISFFASALSAAAWSAARPDVTGPVLGQQAAHQRGVAIFGPLLDGYGSD